MNTMNETLLRGIRFFTRETEILSDLAVICGRGEREELAWDGLEVGEHTLFDLASATKLFTACCAMKLKENGRLRLERPVTDYAPQFRALSCTSVEQVMSFSALLQTPGRVDACGSWEEAERCLFAAENRGKPGQRAYSDIPAMVMKYVIEGAADRPFFDCVREMVLAPAGMTDTWARVPEHRRTDCLRYAGEYRIEGSAWIHREGPERGIPHDPKAGILQGDTNDLCGHAGLFSSLKDMARFGRSLLEGAILSPASLAEMAVNRTGRLLPEGGYSQYLGYLCYVRHPDQYYSEIPAYMGQRAFGIGGFTGNHVSLDPERGLFTVFLGNRVRDRLTVLLPEEGRSLTDYGLRKDGVGHIRWTDGREIPSSVNYVHQKDAHLHSAVARVLGVTEVPFTW